MRGEVKFTAGGQVRVLRFTANRICDLEADSGRRIQDWAEELADESRSSVPAMRTLFAVGLGCVPEEAGEVMDELGLPKTGELIGRALSVAFSGVDPGEGAAGGNAAAGKRKAAAR